MVSGTLAGRTLRELSQQYPDELLGRGWRGPYFPVLTKFIDATGMLPVHLHANDEAARRLEQQPNGKTEAWHILDAAPGATALVGVMPGVDREVLRDALLRQEFDTVMRRLPVRAGETIYVPGGTIHSFGPHTLIYEIEQTSDIQQHAMTWNMEDGSHVSVDQWHNNIDKLLEEWDPEPRPDFHPGLRIRVSDGIERVVCCAGPYFALERWRVGGAEPLTYSFETAIILSNVGGPILIRTGHWADILGRAETVLLPAALRQVQIGPPKDVLIGFLPDIERDIREPLAVASYAPEIIAELGEVPVT